MKLTIKELANCLSASFIAPQNLNLPDEGHLIADVLWGSKVASENTLCTKVFIDSREVSQGSVFCCIKGEHQDGHDFAIHAAKAGACLIIAERDPFGEELRKSKEDLPVVFLVDDGQKALWRIAMIQRAKTKAKVIGITGSAGKTTLKESLAHVLAGIGKTEKNYKNFNTQIGLSVSLINADEDAAFWVMEAGISQPHDMDELGAILRPDVGIILNVALAHAEGLGDKGVAWYKSQLLHYVNGQGTCFVSADYDDLCAAEQGLQAELSEKKITVHHFSTSKDNVFSHAYFEGVEKRNNQFMGVFTAMVNGKTYHAVAPFAGPYGAEHIAVLFAVAVSEGMAPELICERVSTINLPDQRFNTFTLGNAIIIDDSYNANPLSSKKMVQAAAQVASFEGKELTLVMGEMRELGEESKNLHTALGQDMAKSGAINVMWKGGHAEDVSSGLTNFKGTFHTPKNSDEFLALIKNTNIHDHVILFKGSRGTHLEEWLHPLTTCWETKDK